LARLTRGNESQEGKCNIPDVKRVVKLVVKIVVLEGRKAGSVGKLGRRPKEGNGEMSETSLESYGKLGKLQLGGECRH
jgi:hypothetical protein